ncbi:MAG TPA: SDR family NAD(P)-dependent oxidoreductase [Alphaproteobacteria bacterium]
MITAASKLAVITGASSGIGFELAKQFIDHDYDIIIAADTEKVFDAADALRGKGKNIEPVKADLSTYDGVEMLYQKIRDCGRPIDAIALNAGVGVGGDFITNDLNRELEMINLNVKSVVQLSKRVIPDMVSRGKGKILFTASSVSISPAPYLAVYGATKAFVLSFADAIREELKDTGVTITSLMPNATDTNFFARADMEDTRVGEMKKDDPALVAKQGFEAMMDGEAHVYGGSIKSKLMTASEEIMPENLKGMMQAAMSKPGSAKHH